jgi:hypothetical protein
VAALRRGVLGAGQGDPVGRWRFLARRVPVCALAATLLAGSAADQGAAEAAGDSWSPATVLRTDDGWYAAPIHSTVLPDGRVLLFGVARETWPATRETPVRRVAFLLDPAQATGESMTVDEIAEPVEIDALPYGTYEVRDDLYCSGHTLTADGRVVTAGGTRAFVDPASNATPIVLGLHYQTEFDPGTGTWTRLPGAMVGRGQLPIAARWYPTLTRLPDGRILTVGGFELVAPLGLLNFSSETYDPATGTRAVGAAYGRLPKAVVNRDYTHTFVLPARGAPYDLLMLGESGQPVLASTSDLEAFAPAGPARPNSGGAADAGTGQSTVQLPLRVRNREWGYANGSILTVGGKHGSPLMRQADVYDPSQRAWTTIDTGVMRHHPATVGLPDGRILVLTGHNTAGDTGVLRAQYLDPANGFTPSEGTAELTEMRGYHTVATLLPDGRVLVAGGRGADTATTLEQPTLQYYSPDYLQAPRPVVTAAPTAVGYGSLFAVQTSGPAPAEVVLVSLGSMTHSFDQNQRVVQLPVGAVLTDGESATVVAGGPPDSHYAPPGHYMLFVLDEHRVPSHASIVRVA